MTQSTAGALLKGVRISPYKVSAVAGLLRARRVSDAMDQLLFNKTRAAYLLRKLLSSAIANAENNHNMNPDYLCVERVEVAPGPSLKRFRPRARGRGAAIKKRSSNIRLVLSVINS